MKIDFMTLLICGTVNREIYLVELLQWILINT